MFIVLIGQRIFICPFLSINHKLLTVTKKIVPLIKYKFIKNFLFKLNLKFTWLLPIYLFLSHRKCLLCKSCPSAVEFHEAVKNNINISKALIFYILTFAAAKFLLVFQVVWELFEESYLVPELDVEPKVDVKVLVVVIMEDAVRLPWLEP